MPRSVYATIPDLRALLPNTTTHPDSFLADRLEYACDVVDTLTSQVFGPTRKAVDVDGWGRRGAAHPYRWKIIELESLRQIDLCGDELSEIPQNVYVVKDRLVRLRPRDKNPDTFSRAMYGIPTTRFNWDDMNVRLDAVWGDMSLGEKKVTTLAADLARGATTVSITDTFDLLPKDVLMIADKFWVIVQEVTVESTDLTPGEILVDPVPFSAAAGDPVVYYGAIHSQIREATLRTALAHSNTPGSEDEIELERRNRIRREDTDNYEIEFFQGGSGGTATGAGFWSGTGDPIADTILGRFKPSPIVGRWA